MNFTEGESIVDETWLHTGDTLQHRNGRKAVIVRIEYLSDLSRVFHLVPLEAGYKAGTQRGFVKEGRWPSRNKSSVGMGTLKADWRRIHTPWRTFNHA